MSRRREAGRRSRPGGRPLTAGMPAAEESGWPAWSEGGELGRLAGGRDERHGELVRVSFERLCAIAKARQALTSGAVSVLELPRVVEWSKMT